MMKQIKIPMLALGVIAGGLLSSCTNENEPSRELNSNNMLAMAPKVLAYSGTHTWNGNNGTRAANTNANEWNQNWDCPPRPAEDLTADELEELKALLSKGREVHNDIVLPFENYYVQQIYKGEDSYYTHDRCYQTGCDHVNSSSELGSGHMDKLVAYNPSDVFEYRPEDNWQGAWYTNDYEHINNFDHGTNTNTPGQCGCGESHYKTTLMTGMPTDGIDPERQFGFHETWGTAHDYNNYIIVEYKGYYYVGFDYEAHKYDQDTHNHGEGMDIERDWNFTDWIVRITPAYHKGETPAENPGGILQDDKTPLPDEEDNCDECGHPSHDGEICDDCVAEGRHDTDCTTGNNGQPGNPDEENPGENNPGNDNPGDDVQKGIDEVEINLALDKKNDDLLESHLSMHVRSATDVEVFIPVPAQYYCDADDMMIVLEHAENFVHGGPYVTEYNINGNIVTLNVAFEEDGIRIWTDGINQDVIDYCRETYNDGITFEVWNYFNDPEKVAELTGGAISMEDLKYLLNKATVRFLDKTPGEYINSFGTDNGKYEENSNKDGNDFHVTPEAQMDEFYGPKDGPHYNGSDNNEIYTNKNKE